jgi:hypothetical protein
VARLDCSQSRSLPHHLPDQDQPTLGSQDIDSGELNIRGRETHSKRVTPFTEISVPQTKTTKGANLHPLPNLAGKDTAPGKMASYIQLHMELDTRDCNPTPQQRAVYSYHEEIHSDAADDIYSFEWFERTKLFFKQFGRPEKRVTTLRTWEMVEELDFGAFFLAHPVAAYSLWHLLQACYDLDRVVCGCSQEELAKRKAMKPFVYLRAKRIRIQWVKSLKHLKEKIECGTLEGDELVRTLYDILCGVERLVASSTALKENFAVNLRDMIFVDKMLQKVTTFVDDRCGMIAAHLKLEESQETSRQENESSSDEALGKDPETFTERNLTGTR